MKTRETMSQLQAALDFQVELGKFNNVDLFQRGYYQIRVTFKHSSKITAKVDVNLTKSSGSNGLLPASVSGCSATSKTFQILYRKEEVEINDVVLFKVNMLVDVNKIEECIADADFQLIVELLFTEDEYKNGTSMAFAPISERTLRLHMSACKGIHHHVPLLFDYFHLAAVFITVHASLIALHQPYIAKNASGVVTITSSTAAANSADRSNAAPATEDVTMQAILFGASLSSANNSSKNLTATALKRQTARACGRYRQFCRILLAAYESLQTSLELCLSRVSSSTRASIDVDLQTIDCHQKLEDLCTRCQNFMSRGGEDEDLYQLMQSDLSTLCGQNVILWSVYLQVVTLSPQITRHLAKEHHTQRVKRFAEGFIVNEFQKPEAIACFDSSLHGHSEIAGQIRLSDYYQFIPPLPVECTDVDGDFATIPIIFEDIYTEPRSIVVQPAASGLPGVASSVPNVASGLPKAVTGVYAGGNFERHGSYRVAKTPKGASKAAPVSEADGRKNSLGIANAAMSIPNAGHATAASEMANRKSSIGVPGEAKFGGVEVRRKDRHSLDGSTLSHETSAMVKMKRQSKLKLLKNLRPESILRPGSSYVAAELEGQVARDETDCTLVGYRKVPAVGTIGGVQLGTLTPTGESEVNNFTRAIAMSNIHTERDSISVVTTMESTDIGSLYNAASLPTLQDGIRLCNSIGGSLPELASGTSLISGSLLRESLYRRSSAAACAAAAVMAKPLERAGRRNMSRSDSSTFSSQDDVGVVFNNQTTSSNAGPALNAGQQVGFSDSVKTSDNNFNNITNDDIIKSIDNTSSDNISNDNITDSSGVGSSSTFESAEQGESFVGVAGLNFAANESVGEDLLTNENIGENTLTYESVAENTLTNQMHDGLFSQSKISTATNESAYPLTNGMPFSYSQSQNSSSEAEDLAVDSGDVKLNMVDQSKEKPCIDCDTVGGSPDEISLGMIGLTCEDEDRTERTADSVGEQQQRKVDRNSAISSGELMIDSESKSSNVISEQSSNDSSITENLERLDVVEDTMIASDGDTCGKEMAGDSTKSQTGSGLVAVVDQKEGVPSSVGGSGDGQQRVCDALVYAAKNSDDGFLDCGVVHTKEITSDSLHGDASAGSVISPYQNDAQRQPKSLSDGQRQPAFENDACSIEPYQPLPLSDGEREPISQSDIRRQSLPVNVATSDEQIPPLSQKKDGIDTHSLNDDRCTLMDLIKEEASKNSPSLPTALASATNLSGTAQLMPAGHIPSQNETLGSGEKSGISFERNQTTEKNQTGDSFEKNQVGGNSEKNQLAACFGKSLDCGEGMLTRDGGESSTSGSQLSMVSCDDVPDGRRVRSRLVTDVHENTVQFICAKEKLRKKLNFNGHFYSDFPSQVSDTPYFWPPEKPLPLAYTKVASNHATSSSSASSDGTHLIVCVHGLDGNSTDLRLVRTYLELAMPDAKVEFLMSERNQVDTFSDFEVMTDRLVQEILYHIDLYGIKVSRISFVGHSLGNLIIRSAMSRPQMVPLLPKLHTFLSLSGPHLGTLFNSSGLVNMGMWLMQKWKKSGSLLQLSMKDHSDLRQTFLYRLSQKTGLEFFKNILLVGSQQDRYVPYHSSRIEMCKAALRDSSTLGAVYEEMVKNILHPIIYKTDINFIRYDVFHSLTGTTNNLIGRAAHIAVLDSELFIEKFVTVAALKYFL